MLPAVRSGQVSALGEIHVHQGGSELAGPIAHTHQHLLVRSAKGSQEVGVVALHVSLHNGHRVGLALVRGTAAAAAEGAVALVRTAVLVQHPHAGARHAGVEAQVVRHASPHPVRQGLRARDDVAAVDPFLDRQH